MEVARAHSTEVQGQALEKVLALLKTDQRNQLDQLGINYSEIGTIRSLICRDGTPFRRSRRTAERA